MGASVMSISGNLELGGLGFFGDLSRQRQVKRGGHLEGHRIALDHVDGNSQAFDEGSIVRRVDGLVGGTAEVLLVRAAQQGQAKTLRRLHGTERRTIGGSDDDVAGHLLDRVRHGHDRNDGVAAADHRTDDAGDHAGRRQCACGVVHEDDAVIGHGAHALPDGIDALAAADDESDVGPDSAGVPSAAEQLAGVPHHVLGDDDGDVIDGLGTFDRRDGTLHERTAEDMGLGKSL